MTKKTYSILAVIGALLWGAAIFLRNTSLMDNDIIANVLWRLPNFGVVWIGVGLTVALYPNIFKKEFNDKYFYLLSAVGFAILLLSEVIHIFLGAAFDVWDMAASALALLFIILMRIFMKKSVEE